MVLIRSFVFICLLSFTIISCEKEAPVATDTTDYKVTRSTRPVRGCTRQDNVGYWQMDNVLNNVVACGPQLYCAGFNNHTTEVYGYGAGSLWQGSSSEVFDIVEQDDLIEAARQYAIANNPNMCNGSPMVVKDYEFFLDFLVGSNGYFIGVEITYACCGSPIH